MLTNLEKSHFDLEKKNPNSVRTMDRSQVGIISPMFLKKKKITQPIPNSTFFSSISNIHNYFTHLYTSLFSMNEYIYSLILLLWKKKHSYCLVF